MARRRDRGKRARMLNSMVSFLLQPLPGGEPVAVAAALAELAEPLWGVTLVIMWSVDEVSGQLQLAGVSGADRNRVEEVLRADEPFVKELMDGGKPVVVKDLSRETGWGNRELLDITAHEALLGAPVVVDGRPVGVFVLLSSNPDRFTPWDESVLEIFARHLATAWEVSLTRGALKKTKEKLILTERFELLAKSAVGKAHDFNNFLGLVLGNLYLLRPRLDPSDREAFRIIDVMEQTIMGATNTIKSLQELTSKTAESPRVVTPVDLNEVAEDVLEMLRVKFKEALAKGISIEVQKRLQLKRSVLADPATLREALLNVVLNSIHAMPMGGRLTLRTWEGSGTVHLAVSDTGVGMSQEVRSRIFEPFFSTKVGVGVGMGMAMTHDLIKSQQGEVEVKSEVGQGTTVLISLPKVAEHVG
ncbi:MAG: GAF domain-containing sensor histidine kinase [Nitrospinae bacterium]|nr:GAF domain-containing sensor histidine kinase [Nitrospinota bacterium]